MFFGLQFAGKKEFVVCKQVLALYVRIKDAHG